MFIFYLTRVVRRLNLQNDLKKPFKEKKKKKVWREELKNEKIILA